MSTIKSLDELKSLRDKYKSSIDVRNAGDAENKTRISVGMATCGIAAGARETINAIIDEVRKQQLENIAVVQTGCMGYCYAEPVVEISMPGQEPVLYGNIDAAKGRELVSKHLKGGQVQKAWVLERTRY